ncbi:uncharacterized protein LOC123318311 [Coccinella septempunctata]|uniref:uncharacterized protein LOC123318311 n=1 Tax=Coccinella septempunctata TaxID=41139 RepID=UPI001D07B7D0|nr:uncharacterized protein LOC123318311 [Coccinella septempunctata]
MILIHKFPCKSGILLQDFGTAGQTPASRLGRNGWNNNPTAYQFYYTFRRLCLNIDLKVLKGNCDILDNTKMLTSSTSIAKRNVSTELDLGDMAIIEKYGIDYNELVIEDDEFMYIVDILPSLSLLNENVVVHIAGYVVRSIYKQIKCTECLDSLEESHYKSNDRQQFMLLHRKDRGGLIKPSKDIIQVCMYTEKKIRQLLNITNNLMPTEKNFLDTFIMQASLFLVQQRNIFKCLEDHVFDTSRKASIAVAQMNTQHITTVQNPIPSANERVSTESTGVQKTKMGIIDNQTSEMIIFWQKNRMIVSIWQQRV